MSDTPIYDDIQAGKPVSRVSWQDQLEIAVQKFFEEGNDVLEDLRTHLEDCINDCLAVEDDLEEPDPDEVYDRIKDQESGL